MRTAFMKLKRAVHRFMYTLQYKRADRKNWEAKMKAPIKYTIISYGK